MALCIGPDSGPDEQPGVELSLQSLTHQELLRLLDLLPAPSVLALDALASSVKMNRAFTDLLGLPPEFDAHNCLPDQPGRPYSYWRDGRQLQSEELPMHLCMNVGAEVRDIDVEIRMEDGRVFHVVGNAAPLRDGNGAISGAIATFSDVSDSKRLAQMHEAIRQERDAASERLVYLARAGQELSESLDLRAVLDTLGRILVPRFADCLATALLDERGQYTISQIHHKSRDMVAEMAALRERTNSNGPGTYPVAERVLARGRGEIIEDFRAMMEHPQADAGYREYVRQLVEVFDFRSAIVVPLINRGEPAGIFTAIGGPDRHFTEDDLQLLEELGRRAASAVQNARTYERQRQVAETLQQALLPSGLPKIAELAFDAVYVAGDDEAHVGGDWYDAFMLSARRIAVSIGDVTGRGIDAAILMGKARQNIRALSLLEEDPAKLLDATDAAIRRNNPDLIVTALVGVLDLDTLQFTYATAGHPAPWLRRAKDVVLELPCHGLPLGLREGYESSSVCIQLLPEDVILLFTDGLLESTHDLAEGERRIRNALTELEPGAVTEAANTIREAVLYDGSRDDVAVLSVHVRAGTRGDSLTWSFDARDARLAHQSRSFFLQYLVERGAPGSDFSAAELVFGEMIGNVVRHAAGPVHIAVDWTQSHPLLEITDSGGGFDIDAALPLDPLSEAGRGLFLIEALTESFEVHAVKGGTRACAVLRIQR